MQITYEHETDALEIRWSVSAERTEWRTARRDVDLLIDEANEPLAMRIRRAKWLVPDVTNATADMTSQVSWIERPTLMRIPQIEEAWAAATAELLGLGHTPNQQPQLPFDEPITGSATFNRQAKGHCQWCGAVAPDRRRATTRCGWPAPHMCPACAARELGETPRVTTTPAAAAAPIETPAEREREAVPC